MRVLASSNANGMIWWSTPRATCGLTVRHGRVTACAPYVRRWALGRDARELWREQARRPGVTLAWIEDEPQSYDGLTLEAAYWNGSHGTSWRRELRLWRDSDGLLWLSWRIGERERLAGEPYESDEAAHEHIAKLTTEYGRWRRTR